MRFVIPIVVGCALSSCNPPAAPAQPKEQTMETDTNRQLVRRLYDECINPGRLERLADFVSGDFVGPGNGRGPESFAATIGALRAGFPDLAYKLEDVVADGDRVAVRWTLRGTHTGTFRTFSPTGKKIANRGFAVFHLAGGKIVGATVETDRLGFLLDIGAIAYDPAFGPPPLVDRPDAGAR
jgi:predicted ester cyclase